MEEVRAAWLTATEEAWPPRGFGPIVVACGRFDFPASGQLGVWGCEGRSPWGY